MLNVPVFKPLLPKAAALLPYLERIDAARYYSNLGPLTREFESRLAAHFRLPEDRVVTSANGTLALTQVLNAYGVRVGSLCVMPSWTFIATPAAAMAAGMVPYFIDVEQESWAITPETVLAMLDEHEVGAVIPVSPFGAPLDVAAWEDFHRKTGIPVVIDAAAGFDSLSVNPRALQVPIMVSLHATKVFGIGEGAVVLTGNAEFAARIRMYGNFGFHDSREAHLPGINAKLNEYMSAVGLASLDVWDKTRVQWQDLSNSFAKHVATLPELAHAPGFNDGWVSSYGQVIFPKPCAKQIKEKLQAKGIGTVGWWGDGCHTHEAYADCPRAPLPVTEHLAQHALGLPFWLGLGEKEYTAIFDALRSVMGASHD